jgi:hypothetical protein
LRTQQRRQAVTDNRSPKFHPGAKLIGKPSQLFTAHYARDAKNAEGYAKLQKKKPHLSEEKDEA